MDDIVAQTDDYVPEVSGVAFTSYADPVCNAEVARLRRVHQEALERLEREARGCFRQSGRGQLIEALGCILTERKGSWWPADSVQPHG